MHAQFFKLAHTISAGKTVLAQHTFISILLIKYHYIIISYELARANNGTER